MPERNEGSCNTPDEASACEAELTSYSDYLASDDPDAVYETQKELLRKWHDVRNSGGNVPEKILRLLDERKMFPD